MGDETGFLATNHTPMGGHTVEVRCKFTLKSGLVDSMKTKRRIVNTEITLYGLKT